MSKKAARWLVAGFAVVAFVMFAFWAWHGSVTAVGRIFMASASWKLVVVALVVGALALLAANMVGEEKKGLRRVSVAVAIVSLVAIVLGLLVVPMVGGYARSTALVESVSMTDDAQADYDWRTPWVVASRSASSRAGNVVGDFATDDTTFLPGSDSFSTPVAARGFVAGLGNVVVQQASSSTAKACTFASEAPKSGGMFAANLTRAISFVDPGLEFSASDAWVYCDGDKAKLVVPVIRMAGQPEAHPVPGGVVVYDGAQATLMTEVKSGELPGPVYPSSLAAAQRESMEVGSGLLDKVFGRAGFETSEDTDGDPNSGNVSEILLAKKSGGWDYVTPLTPRGKSFTVTALASVPADHVKAGELNPLVVHRLAEPREGNQALADRVKAAFPQLGWAAGLQLVEVVPTSAGTWEASLVNGRAVANRVQVKADGAMCLLSAAGREISCVDASGSAQAPTDATGATPTSASVPASSDLDGLSDAELAQLALEVASEQLRRANASQQ